MPESESEKQRLGLAQLSWELGEVKKRLNEGAKTFSRLATERRSLLRWALGAVSAAGLAVVTTAFNVGIAYSEARQQRRDVVKMEVRVDDMERIVAVLKMELERVKTERDGDAKWQKTLEAEIQRLEAEIRKRRR